MKIKLSISMEPEMVKKAEVLVKEGRFRNKSHIIEYALKSYLKNDQHGT
ncbi:ribbon-helix-helix protein, CopG family [Candidatus Woesearchaeota archaeon]|nr:ribbon-helix-helix protein, CopG family [Candidatus Woesearchaeota archaeon]